MPSCYSGTQQAVFHVIIGSGCDAIAEAIGQIENPSHVRYEIPVRAKIWTVRPGTISTLGEVTHAGETHGDDDRASEE